jgi:hypothetical protein
MLKDVILTLFSTKKSITWHRLQHKANTSFDVVIYGSDYEQRYFKGKRVYAIFLPDQPVGGSAAVIIHFTVDCVTFSESPSLFESHLFYYF